jgi:hypothetical protein
MVGRFTQRRQKEKQKQKQKHKSKKIVGGGVKSVHRMTAKRLCVVQESHSLSADARTFSFGPGENSDFVGGLLNLLTRAPIQALYHNFEKEEENGAYTWKIPETKFDSEDALVRTLSAWLLQKLFAYSVYYDVPILTGGEATSVPMLTAGHESFVQEDVVDLCFFPKIILVRNNGLMDYEKVPRYFKNDPRTLSEYELFGFVTTLEYNCHAYRADYSGEQVVYHNVSAPLTPLSKFMDASIVLYVLKQADPLVHTVNDFRDVVLKKPDDDYYGEETMQIRINGTNVPAYQFFNEKVMEPRLLAHVKAVIDAEHSRRVVGYLSDAVIDYYLLLLERSFTPKKNVAVFTSQVLAGKTYNVPDKMLRMVVKKLKLLSGSRLTYSDILAQIKSGVLPKGLALPRTVLIPFNHENGHWFLYCVHKENDAVKCYDSMNDPHVVTADFMQTYNKSFALFLKTLRLVWNLSEEPNSKREDVVPEFDVRLVRYKTPQQDANNCGVFVCYAAKMLCNNPTQQYRFTDENTTEQFCLCFRWHIWFMMQHLLEKYVADVAPGGIEIAEVRPAVSATDPDVLEISD